MKGSIRLVVGLVITLGAVGGIEYSQNDSELFQSLALAVLGLGLVYWSTEAIRKNPF